MDSLGLNSGGVTTNDKFEQQPYVRLLKVRLASERGGERPAGAGGQPNHKMVGFSGWDHKDGHFLITSLSLGMPADALRARGGARAMA